LSLLKLSTTRLDGAEPVTAWYGGKPEVVTPAVKRFESTVEKLATSLTARRLQQITFRGLLEDVKGNRLADVNFRDFCPA